jgi:hypothetical protein
LYRNRFHHRNWNTRQPAGLFQEKEAKIAKSVLDGPGNAAGPLTFLSTLSFGASFIRPKLLFLRVLTG